MRYSGIQPQYFPRLHYFARILNADIFMIRDDAQFVRKHKFPNGKNGKSFQADTSIKQVTGAQFLSVPVQHQKERFLPLFKTKISYDINWVKNHLLTIKIAYAKSKNFGKLFPAIEQVLQKKYDSLSDLNIATTLWGFLILFGQQISAKTLTIEYLNKILKKDRKFRLKEIKKGSEAKAYKSFSTLSANQKILALCKEVGATEDYCGGTAIASYFNEQIFTRAGIKTTVQDWKCKNYPQMFMSRAGFIPNLSIIDLLLNIELLQARAILLA